MVIRNRLPVTRALAKDVNPVQKLLWACALLVMVLARAPLARAATQVTSLAVQIATETAKGASIQGAIRERGTTAAVDARDAEGKGMATLGWPFAALPSFPETISLVPRVSRLLPGPTRTSAQRRPRDLFASSPNARAPPAVTEYALMT